MIRRTQLIMSLALALALPGCVDDYGSFYITKARAADPGCVTPQPATGGIFLPKGLLDVSQKRGYLMFPQVENHMASTSGTAGVELNRVAMREYRVAIDLGEVPGSYPEHLTKYTELTSGTLEPNGQVVSWLNAVPDGLAAALATVIPAAVRPTIVAEVRAFGVRSGSDVETPPFRFPIELCNGCLVDLRPTCPTDETTTTVHKNACGRPQDELVTCCPTAQGGVTCLQSGS